MTEDCKLSGDETMRYSRQLILPEVGVAGQQQLKRSSVLIVGCGGLGCPAAIYLAAAGVGRIGLADHDTVQLSNLHRQILHCTARIGMPKPYSIAETIKSLNSHVLVECHCHPVTSANAVALVAAYQCVLDCTDNVATRYLLSDTCVLADRPLVSAAALRFDGQLTTYNHQGSPCYRCLFPTPPPPETVTNCSDGGVLGVVPGIIGSLQAMEALRVLLPGLSARHAGSLLLYSAITGHFRTVRLRQKQRDCAVCGDAPTIAQPIDYEQFCGAAPSDKTADLCLLDDTERLTPSQFKQLATQHQQQQQQLPALLLLVDVRPQLELDICRPPAYTSTLHVPLGQLQRPEGGGVQLVSREVERLREQHRQQLQQLPSSSHSQPPVTVVTVCRRGNDSQRAARLLQRHLSADDATIVVRDIRGGLYAWQAELEPQLTLY